MKRIPLAPPARICACGKRIKTAEAKVCKACRLAACKAMHYRIADSIRASRPPAITTLNAKAKGD